MRYFFAAIIALMLISEYYNGPGGHELSPAEKAEQDYIAMKPYIK